MRTYVASFSHHFLQHDSYSFYQAQLTNHLPLFHPFIYLLQSQLLTPPPKRIHHVFLPVTLPPRRLSNRPNHRLIPVLLRWRRHIPHERIRHSQKRRHNYRLLGSSSDNPNRTWSLDRHANTNPPPQRLGSPRHPRRPYIVPKMHEAVE